MSNKKIGSIIVFLILLSIIIFIAKKFSYEEYEKNYFYLDTVINVKIVTNKDNIDSVFDEIDYLYSTYNTLADKYNSYDDVINVYCLNNILENNEEIEIDSKLAKLIEEGIKYYDITNGYINIAGGNLIDVWKSYINKGEGIPSDSELEVNTNIDDINLDGNIYSKKNNITIDLGSFTKGYVTELAGSYLESIGIKSYIIDAGGNIKVGTPYKKDNYTVGIIDPINNDDIFTKLNVKNKSIVTSGDYQRYYEYNGIRYNHIINPYTLYPSSIYKSVTVISDNSFLADIYSTYLFLLDIDKGLEIVNNNNDIEAVWYIDNDNIVKSDNFNY